MRTRAARPVIASSLIISFCVVLTACGGQVDPQYAREIDAWHAERIARLTNETGWLTLVGRHLLRVGENRVGSAAGNDIELVATAPVELGTVTVTGTSVVMALADGTVVLDFNRAYNPPCVFTPYATCPLPPDGNHLPLAVEAGEKMWGTSP